MRIGINTLHIIPGQCGGVEPYLCNLVTYLAQIDKENDYILFVREENKFLFDHIEQVNFQKVLIPVKASNLLIRPIKRFFPSIGFSRLYETAKKTYGMMRSIFPSTGHLGGQSSHKLRQSGIVSRLEMSGVDLIHYPATIITPLSISLPCILTFHDMQQEFFPEFFSKNELLHRKMTYEPSARKAAKIIVDSEFVKQTLISRYKIPENRIRVIYLGADPRFKLETDKIAVDKLKVKYHLPDKFAFYPANFWPHKNHIRLLEGLNLLKQRYKSNCKLVLTGGYKGRDAEISTKVRQLGLQEDVFILGYVPNEEMPYLYSAASLLVVPSLYEGFGIPTVEAMASGCPIICSNSTCLPEIVGNAAILVNPYNPEEIASAMHKVLDNRELRQKLIQRGLERAKNFSWRKTASQTLNVYKEVFEISQNR